VAEQEERERGVWGGVHGTGVFPESPGCPRPLHSAAERRGERREGSVGKAAAQLQRSCMLPCAAEVALSARCMPCQCTMLGRGGGAGEFSLGLFWWAAQEFI
jgi:hypothetical protein